MTLISGKALDPKRFFKDGKGSAQGSSFDLTIGKIFGANGQEIIETFKLRPGHMVQVMSEEVFQLQNNVTGHVTYKTSLTRIGVWALTVGIVDPGWSGPIATTLLNFSRTDFAVQRGDPFLRVSFFEHDEVPAKSLRKSPSESEYAKGVSQLAVTKFSKTFLNRKKIERRAGNDVMNRIRNQALAWVAGIVVVFTIAQIVVAFFVPKLDSSASELFAAKTELMRIERELQLLKANDYGQIKRDLDVAKLEIEAIKKLPVDNQQRTVNSPIQQLRK
jgi:deoxycytidine triphosphate deaminase